MNARTTGLKAAAAIGTLAIGLAACGGGGSGSSTSDNGTPVKGGILKLVGAGDVDHLDTASGYTTVADVLERAWARRLFAYKASNDPTVNNQIAPDIATEIPTMANGGISADGKTYTVKLRPDVMWNTQPARPVVAGDFVRGLKRLCNPNPNGTSGAAGYYKQTIAGFSAYCDGYAKVAKNDAKAMADYQNGHEIAGLSAPDDQTVVFKLTQPAADFLSILSLDFAAPAPKEYDAYVPDSTEFRQHTISSGPYQITKYVATKEIDLGRNPAWKPASDPLHKAYVDGIQVVEGEASPDAVEQQIEAGTADLSWDQAVPTATIATMRASKDPRLAIFPGANSNPQLRFNFQSPNNNKAMANLHIRQAIEYAINKDALAKIYGGTSLNKPLSTAIPPGSVGYQPSDIYPTPNFQGDVNKCKTLLAQGEKEVGVTSMSLTLVYRNSSNHPKIAVSVSNDLKACGIGTKLVSTTPDDYYGKFLSSPDASKEGKWDISAPGWNADWPGNNGRAFLVPLFDGRTCGAGSINYGCYNSPITNKLIDQALAAPTQAQAAQFWAQADQQIMKDAAFVPFMQQQTPVTRSKRVHNTQYMAIANQYDPTTLWLSK